MPHVPSPEITPLVCRARIVLDLTQRELGTRFGVSHRTASRWEAGRSHPGLEEIHAMARAVHARDPSLAAALASEGGTTLEALGLVAPPSGSAGGAPAAPPPRPFPPIALMIDSILLAAMDVAELHENAVLDREGVRRVLHAAFQRARGLGLTVDEVDQALNAAGAPASATAKDKAPKR
jgi:transcriptional regulator with XRE-family HTH domain